MRNLLLILSVMLCMTTKALAVETQALQVYMVDLQTGVVLLEKNADQQMAPSSMSKILTAHLIFKRLKNGDVKLDDTLLVSEAAWRTGGSKMFVKLNSKVSVEDLIYGIVVQSGNDACVVAAEGLAGS